jgi:hypothetical protein
MRLLSTLCDARWPVEVSQPCRLAHGRLDHGEESLPLGMLDLQRAKKWPGAGYRREVGGLTRP